MSNQNTSGAAVGLTMFASVMMMIVGVFEALAGISAIAKDDVFFTTVNYTFKLDLTGWGWIHLLLGILVFLAGLALLQGAVWARTVAVILASISMIANFLWLPYQPWWSILMIALAAFVIWAVTVHGRDISSSQL
jgi:hypothetical protein